VSSIVVWDAPDTSVRMSRETVLWRSYAAEGGATSIPQRLEANGARLRDKYLTFVQSIGEHRIRGARVIDHFAIDDDFSLWWMTLIAEKSPFKSPRIYDCLRLLALEEVVLERRVGALTLVSADRALARALGELCKALEIDFRWTKSQAAPLGQSLARRLYGALPHFLKGMLSFRHLAARWPLRRARHRQWFAGDAAVFFCSYFIHLDPRLCSGGTFHSRHWETLPKFLQEHGKSANWLQLFLKSAVVPSVETGLAWVRRFNENSRLNGRHGFVESYLTWPVVARIVKRWVRLVVLASRLRGVREAFVVGGSRVSLWTLLRDDWYAALCGPIGVDNCAWLELFDAALRDVPPQKLGLYLFENHAWEKALLRSWRKNGHGRIIGVQHSTVPFWYLPHFEDRRAFARAPRSLPLPDFLAVNGRGARDALAAGGWPTELLRDVEALRYLGIAEAPQGRAAARPAVRILVLGDIAPASMEPFLALVNEAAKLVPSTYEITFKPHPGYAPDLSTYPLLAARQTHESLAKILGDHDVAVAANNTSAAIDAYLAGLPVAIALSGDGFNLSPLRGESGVFFVGTPAALAAALRDCVAQRAPAGERAALFSREPDLRRWKDLLRLPT